MQVEDQVVLDYGDADDDIPSQREPEPTLRNVVSEATVEDWSTAEARWDSLDRILDKSQVVSGMIVGWKVSVTSQSLPQNLISQSKSHRL